MASVRDQLSSLTLAELTAAQTSSAGGKVFVSNNAVMSQLEMNEIVSSWQSIHVPTYGMPIPGSGTSLSATASATLLNLDTNQTGYINALSMTNGGTDVLTVNILVGVAVYSSKQIPPGTTGIFVGAGPEVGQPFYLADGLSLGCTVSGGSIGDLTMGLAYSLAVQG